MSDIIHDKVKEGITLADNDVEEYAFDLNEFYQSNIEKCKKCIYEDAYDRSLNMGD